MNSSSEIAAARAALGKQLAAYRKAAGYTQHTFAPLTHYGRSTIANVEAGRQNVPRAFWERCDDLLQAAGALMAGYDCLAELIRDQRRQLADARSASRLADFAGQQPRTLVADLARTTADQRELYHRLSARVMLSYASAHLAALELLLDDPVLSLDVRAVASMAQEAAGLVAWLQHDLGVPGAADRAYGIADRLLSLSGDRSLAGYVTAYRAEVAKDRSDLRAAVTHFERAQAMLGRSAPPMVLAWTSAVGAEVMAFSGRASAAMHLLSRAESALDRAGSDPGAAWMYEFDEPRLAMHRGTCFLALRRPDAARREFERALAATPVGRVRRRSEMTVGLARVSLAEGDAAQAQRHCVDALDGFARVRSARGFRLVQVIRDRISAVGGIASVCDLDDRVWQLLTADG